MLENFARLMARINDPSDDAPLRCETWANRGIWCLSVFRQVSFGAKTGRDTLVYVKGVHLDELAREALAALGSKS